MEQCLRNFYSSETFAMLKDLPQELWLEVEDFSSFSLNKTKIWALPFVAYFDKVSFILQKT
jgi:hypothetical protein